MEQRSCFEVYRPHLVRNKSDYLLVGLPFVALKWFGFDIRKAFSGLFGLSNTLNTYGKGRFQQGTGQHGNEFYSLI